MDKLSASIAEDVKLIARCDEVKLKAEFGSGFIPEEPQEDGD
ncbi:hypothetical protein [Tepidanaerobacter syntrophicus]|nr:hypothetical protein [Tepidanaerobacter syntrophicus]